MQGSYKNQGLESISNLSLVNQIRDTRQELLERADLTDLKIDVLNNKIDAVDGKLSKNFDDLSIDLKAHRADTEAHHGIYLVKEG